MNNTILRKQLEILRMVTLRMADQLRENGGLTVNMYQIDSCFFVKSLVKPFVHAMQKEF